MGYGNFKLPLLFVVMLLPLIFNGPGRFSLDELLARLVKVETFPTPVSDFSAWALAAAILGVPFLMLLPAFGAALLAIALVLAIAARFARR
jgi:putative oxidoreductase